MAHQILGQRVVILAQQWRPLRSRGDDIADGVQGERIAAIPGGAQLIARAHRLPQLLVERQPAEVVVDLLGEVVA